MSSTCPALVSLSAIVKANRVGFIVAEDARALPLLNTARAVISVGCPNASAVGYPSIPDSLLAANAESNAAVQRAVASAEALSTPHPADLSNSSPLSAPSSPLSPITIDDLAKSLRRIIDSAFAAPEVERAHELLERYESQKKLGVAVAATGWTSAYVVELEPGCWLADGKGDPARTIVLSNARIFKSHTGAEVSVINARRHRPFRNAKVVEVKASAIGGSNG